MSAYTVLFDTTRYDQSKHYPGTNNYRICHNTYSFVEKNKRNKDRACSCWSEPLSKTYIFNWSRVYKMLSRGCFETSHTKSIFKSFIFEMVIYVSSKDVFHPSPPQSLTLRSRLQNLNIHFKILHWSFFKSLDYQYSLIDVVYSSHDRICRIKE